MVVEDRVVAAVAPIAAAGDKSDSCAFEDDEDIENKELDIKVDEDAEADFTKDEDDSFWYWPKVRLVFICVLLVSMILDVCFDSSLRLTILYSNG